MRDAESSCYLDNELRIHGQWKLKATINVCEFNGEDLQGSRDVAGASQWDESWCVVCKLHRSQHGCTYQSEKCGAELASMNY